ncbi:hypothetical protein HKW91_43290, partial [Pseudomonas aeruginosa]|nr:hypothetical protein [Pseudomonas aeruginosa]
MYVAETVFVEKAPVAKTLTAQELLFQFLFLPHNAMLVAVRNQLVHVGQLWRFIAEHAQNARAKVLAHFKGFVVRLSILEADTT